MTHNITSEKEIIIQRFMNNVKRKVIVLDSQGDGAEGHWLEKQMGLMLNSKNLPDIFGYEMKKESVKITFGDFSASKYLYSPPNNKITRTDFIRIFGTAKNGRFSWSGSCVPTYGEYNDCGQIMTFDDTNNLNIYYSYDVDTREYKTTFPDFIKVNNLLIAFWSCDKLSKHINDKYNNKGFFICKKEGNVYERICFGIPFGYPVFVDAIKRKNIIFDSGMHEGNNRNYSSFRSTAKSFWDLLLIEEF